MTELLPVAGGPPAADAPVLARLLWRFRYVWPLVSVSLGLASFLLIERREGMARWLAALLIAGWALILLESMVGRLVARLRPRWGRASPWLMRFLIQGLHQETFFFSLPFFLHTTTWTSPQALFTLAVGSGALISSWDTLYYLRVTARSWSFLAFHAFSVYVAMLVMLPLLLHIDTHDTLAWSAAAVALLAVPSLAEAFGPRGLRLWLLSFGTAALLGGAAWFAKPLIPPATLWVRSAVITRSIDVEARKPGPALQRIALADLGDGGLYAYSAIRAPRGLEEKIYHRWLRDGWEVDRIALHIEGGREQGYRAWTHKQDFTSNPRSDWQVQIVTESGQLIGRVAFRIE